MDEIINLYNSGLSYKDISEKCNCSQYTVWNRVKKSGIKMRGSGNSKPTRINPFLSFSPEAMYWLGYIMADGTITATTKQHTLVLFSTNRDILEKYNLFMNNFCKIHLWVNNVYGARTHNKILCDWLINTCNITPNKSLTLNPNLPITWDLLRGYFDGDGSIRLQGYHTETKFTTGSEIWAKRIYQFLKDNDIYSVITPKDKCFDVNIYRKNEVEKLYKLMYKDASIYLGYKYNRFVALFGNK